jgi:hypothetical protein
MPTLGDPHDRRVQRGSVLVGLVVTVSLILGLTVVVTIPTLEGVGGPGDPQPGPDAPLGETPQEIAASLAEKLEAYKAKRGNYPWRFWPANYLLLGLDPLHWVVGIDGVRYAPNGHYVELINAARDQYQMYVQATDGTLLSVSDGDSVWLDITEDRAYYLYHPGEVPNEELIEVALETLRVVQTQ